MCWLLSLSGLLLLSYFFRFVFGANFIDNPSQYELKEANLIPFRSQNDTDIDGKFLRVILGNVSHK